METDAARVDVDAVISRLREAVKVTTDVALGDYFGLSKNTVSTWRKRQSVPFAQCVMLAQAMGCSLDWLILGRELPSPAGAAAAGGANPSRVARMVGFLHHWHATHDADDVVWLERTLARTVPEYGEWLAGQNC